MEKHELDVLLKRKWDHPAILWPALALLCGLHVFASGEFWQGNGSIGAMMGAIGSAIPGTALSMIFMPMPILKAKPWSDLAKVDACIFLGLLCRIATWFIPRP